MSDSELNKSIKKHLGVSNKSTWEQWVKYRDLIYPFNKEEADFIFLTKLMSLLNNGEGTSSNVLVTGITGIGKDHTIKDIMRLFPFKSHFHFKHTTRKAIIGLGDDFTGVSLHLEEVSSQVYKDETFLAITSMNYDDSSWTVDYRDKEGHTKRELKGKPTLFLSCARPSQVPVDIYRRFNTLHLKDSKRRKELRNNLFIDRRNNPLKYQPKPELLNGINDLFQNRYEVQVPFARELLDAFDTKNLPTQFTSKIGFICDLISAAEIITNKDYERHGDMIKIVATAETYNEIVRPILNMIFQEGIFRLSGNADKLFKLIYMTQKIDGWTVRELEDSWESQYGKKPKYDTIVNNLNKLSDLGIVELDHSRISKNQKPCLTAKLKFQKLTFPYYENGVIDSRIGITRTTGITRITGTSGTTKKRTTKSYSSYSSKNIYRDIENHLNSLKDKEFDKTDFNQFIDNDFTNKDLNNLFEKLIKDGRIFEFKFGRFMLNEK